MKLSLKEYILPTVIIGTFLVYYFDLLKDGMMMSGLLAVVMTLYISMMWAEKVEDERDEYIRSNVDRILYILVLVLLLIDIVYKTFTHESYMSEVIILVILSLSKIILSKTMKHNN